MNLEALTHCGLLHQNKHCVEVKVKFSKQQTGRSACNLTYNLTIGCPCFLPLSIAYISYKNLVCDGICCENAYAKAVVLSVGHIASQWTTPSFKEATE